MVPIYKERVLAESARKLAERTRKGKSDWMPIFKRFLKMEEHRLRLWHNAGGGGREIARQRADLIDIVFRELFDSVSKSVGGKIKDRFMVAAFGGYGRREMNPFSDVDIMFIVDRGKPSGVLEDVIRQTLTALWDIGLKVGHSTRSVAQAIKAANEDPVNKTSMLERRFLLGDRELFNDFKGRFERECVKGKEAAYIKWRLQSQRESHEKFGGSICMQEPNVKNGCGGLRDYQNMLWVAYFAKHISSASKLVDNKLLRGRERRMIEKSYDFLLRVRTEMHYQNGRPIDGLTLQLQGRVATAFEYPQKNILRRCEAFMRDYYRHTRDMYLITRAVLDRMRVEPASEPKFLGVLGKKTVTEKFDGFLARNGFLFAQERDVFREDPHRLLRVFRYSQQRKMELSSELRDLVSRSLPLIDRTFQYARATRETFLEILSHKGEVGPILRAMHEVGVLGRYMPEFGALTCLVQHEFFHRYTADEHTLVCIEKLDEVLFSKDRKLSGYQSLFQKLEDPAILYLSILLHDVGKAANTRRHEEESAILAHRVARRLQLSSERRRMLITLVDSHYSLSHIAQTRNLDDPATVTEFAAIIRNRRKLDALMLLTLADGRGTSDENWSDWKESLVWQLYRKTSKYFEEGPQQAEMQIDARMSLQAEVLDLLSPDFELEVESHFDCMPERYFHAFEAKDVVEHVKIFRAFLNQYFNEPGKALQPVFRWIPRPERGHTEVWVCGWDRERLLERIAGAFVSAHVNILSADIFTRADNLALDIFRVCDTRQLPVTSQRDFGRVEERLSEALKESDFDFTPLIGEPSRLRSYRLSEDAELPTRIVVDNSSHPLYTIVEIVTPDRIGLLYSMLRAFGGAGISIETSRVTTEMGVAMDTFYVTGRDDLKVEDEERIQRFLHRAAVNRNVSG